MTRIIYADLLFIINFLADIIILFLTGAFSGCGHVIRRFVLSALAGALFGTLSGCFFDTGILAVCTVVLLPPVLCFIAFGKRRRRTYINIIMNFYLSSVLLYGGVFAMASFIALFLGRDKLSAGFLVAVLILLGTAFVYMLFSSFCKHSMKRHKGTVTAEVFDGKRSYELSLLVDTGNTVRDPFSSKPVVIVRKDAFDGELINAVCDISDNRYGNDAYPHIKPRVIPVKTVAGTALLYAFIPDDMFLYCGRQKIKADCIIAIDTRQNVFFGNDGIVPEALLYTA